MKKMERKLVWKASDIPSGQYRSFEKRAWPTLYWDSKDGKPAAFVRCNDEYDPAQVRAGRLYHFEVSLCHHTHAEAGNSWRLMKFTPRHAMTLDDIKAWVVRELRLRSEYAPQPKAPVVLEAQPAKCCGTCQQFSKVQIREIRGSFEYTELRCAAGTKNPDVHKVCIKYTEPLK